MSNSRAPLPRRDNSISARRNNSISTLSQIPVPSVIIPENVTRVLPPMIHPFLYSQPQSKIDRISNLYTNIFNIQDSSGVPVETLYNQSSPQVTGHNPFHLHIPIMYVSFSVFREPFTEFLIGILGPPPESAQQMINAFYSLTTDSQIIQFITTMVNNQTPIVNETEAYRLYTSIANRILFPPPTPALTRGNVSNPINTVNPVNAVNTNRNVRNLDEVNRDLTYLFGLGLTATSDNDTMRNTLRRYRELTGRDYTPPATTVSREELEKDLEYLFGLGLTANSGNDTLNDRLAKYRELTGTEYVYNQAGGKYRRKKSKTLRKKNRRMNRKSRNL